MGLPDWYIYRQYIRLCKQPYFRWLYWIPSVLLLIGMLIIFGSFKPHSDSMKYLGIFLITFLCVNVPKVVFTLMAFLLKKVTRRIGFHIALATALTTMGYLLFGAIKGKSFFQVKEISIESKDIPKAFDGYRIIQLSDIHIGSWGEDTRAMQKAVKLILEQNPDLIVFTGDLVNNLASELDPFIPVFSQLKAKDGVYSVLGNHDYSTYIRWDSPEEQAQELVRLKEKQAEMGWQLLNIRHVKLHRGNDSIALIGVENSGSHPFPDHAQLDEAMAGTEGMFQILLSHDPSHWRREVLPKTDIHLMLSGHTHAMQTKIFGFTPSQFIYPENDGLYQEGEQKLYVNVGLGFLLYPMRLGAWPEITLLTLKTK
jgi:predicted MPP superfamily phosphohydrolase